MSPPPPPPPLGISLGLDIPESGLRVPSASVATVLQDTFTRADNASSLGVATTGQTWIPDTAVWGITSNQAALITPGGLNSAYINATKASYTLTMDVVIGNLSSTLVVRSNGLTGASANFLRVLLDKTNDTLNIIPVTAGVNGSSLGNVNVVMPGSGTYTVVIAGNTITVSTPGNPNVLVVTSATHAGNTFVGMIGGSTSDRFDNLLVVG